MGRDLSPTVVCAFLSCNKPARTETAIRCMSCDRLFHAGCAAKCLTADVNGCLYCRSNAVQTNSSDTRVAGTHLVIPDIQVPIDNHSGDSGVGSIVDAIKCLTTQMNNNFSILNNNFEQMRVEISDMQSTLSSAVQASRENSTRIDQLSTVSAEHESKLKNIEGKMSTLECNVLKEVSARFNRQTNLIIFGLHEDTSSSLKLINENDKKLINRLLDYMSIRDLVKIKTIFRIGKFVDNSPKNRPAKVIFNSIDELNLFIQTFWDLRKNTDQYSELSKLTITKDKTVIQQAQHSELKRQLAAMPMEERINWKIKYYGDQPRLIRLQRTK